MTDTLLEDLDLAIEGHPAADADLLALVADVRGQAPRMTPEFAAALDERVLAGSAAHTPARRSSPVRRLRRPTLYKLAPVAVVAAAAIAVVIGTSGGHKSQTASYALKTSTTKHNDATTPQASGNARGPAAEKTPAPSADNLAATPSAVPSSPSAGVAPSVSSATPFTSTSTAPAPGRRVERTTELSMLTTIDNLQPVAAAVVNATQRAHGFVAESQVQITGNEGTAAFTLRIPSEQLESTLTAFTHLAKVTSMSQYSRDITGEFHSTNTQLARLQAQLAALQKRPQTDVTKVKIRQVQRQIASQLASLSQLRHRADYVTVQMTVTGKGHKKHHHVVPVHHGGGFTPGDALHAAARILKVIAAIAVVSLLILIPFAIVLGGIGYTVRVIRRRNRQAALNAT